MDDITLRNVSKNKNQKTEKKVTTPGEVSKEAYESILDFLIKTRGKDKLLGPMIPQIMERLTNPPGAGTLNVLSETTREWFEREDNAPEREYTEKFAKWGREQTGGSSFAETRKWFIDNPPQTIAEKKWAQDYIAIVDRTEEMENIITNYGRFITKERGVKND